MSNFNSSLLWRRPLHVLTQMRAGRAKRRVYGSHQVSKLMLRFDSLLLARPIAARTRHGLCTVGSRPLAALRPVARCLCSSSSESVQSTKSGHSRYPTLEQCAAQARHAHEMSNDVLLLLSAHGDVHARRERFVREVMHVDQLSWPEARLKVDGHEDEISKSHVTSKFEGVVGACAVLLGVGSVPMVFHEWTAINFNELFVTTDVPPLEDLETPLEVGMWTWGWMEPPIGTISFLFICLQFARGRGLYNPFEEWHRATNERKLLERFNRYSPLIVLQWAEAVTPGQDYTARAGPTARGS